MQKDYESEAEFRRNAEAGDLLLFRGLKNTSVVQRAITMDEYGRCAAMQITWRWWC